MSCFGLSLEPYKEGEGICSCLLGERILAKYTHSPQIKPYWKGKIERRSRGKRREESVQGGRGREGKKVFKEEEEEKGRKRMNDEGGREAGDGKERG